MKSLLAAAFTTSALLFASGVMAAQRTATIEVENVSCVTCGPIVKSVLSNMSGVTKVMVVENAGMAWATVTFDDEIVSAEALAEAVTNQGYPSIVTEVKNAMSTPADAVASVP